MGDPCLVQRGLPAVAQDVLGVIGTERGVSPGRRPESDVRVGHLWHQLAATGTELL